MLARETTELRYYGNPYGLPPCLAMSLQDDRRANFKAWMDASGLNMNRVAASSGVSYNTLRSYVGDGTGKQTASLTGVNEAKIASAFNLSVEDIFGEAEAGGWTNNIKAWRDFRRLTVEELAARVEVPASAIEYLEAQTWRPSDKWLRRLAPALTTMPGFLADFDPREVDTAVLDQITVTATTAQKVETASAKKSKAA